MNRPGLLDSQINKAKHLAFLKEKAGTDKVSKLIRRNSLGL